MTVSIVLLLLPLLWFIISSTGQCSISSSNQFYVAFPKMLHSDSINFIWVHRQSNVMIEETTTTLQGSVDVMNMSNSGEAIVHSKAFQLINNTKKISLHLPINITSAIKLRVRLRHSSEGEVFSRDTTVNVHPIERIIFIQTDKPLYKPGDQVRFRVVSVRSDTLTESAPLLLGNTSYFRLINVIKPNQFSIATWKNVSWQNGFEGMIFFLPNDTRLIETGFYKINVILQSGEMQESTFEVKQRSSPRFCVQLTPPKYILVTDKQLIFNVCAKYTNGKPVLGSAKAKVCQSRTICETRTSQLERNGCVDFQFRDLEYLNAESFSPRNRNYPQEFSFAATVFEMETGRFEKTKQPSVVSITDKPFKLKTMSSEYFWPGLPYAGVVIATRNDDSPFPNPRVRISLREDWWMGNRRWGFETVKVGDTNGKIDFQLPILPSTLKSVYITIHSEGYKEDRKTNDYNYNYMGEIYTGFTLTKRSTPSGRALRAHVMEVTKNAVGCDTSLKLQLTGNVPLLNRHIHVQLASKGQVVLWKTFAAVSSNSLITICEDHDGLYGHYTCTRNGKARCLPGWSGSDCMAPVCEGGCLNDGLCVSPNTCKCSRGFKGTNCQTCENSNGCMNGRCIGFRGCVCYYPFVGFNCNIERYDFNWDNDLQGAGTDGTRRSEWIPRAEDDTLITIEPSINKTLRIIEPDLQNITINFRTINVPLVLDSKQLSASGARLAIFSINDDGEMLADSLHLNQLSTCLKNEATKAKFQKKCVQPGHKIELELYSGGIDIQCALSASDVGLYDLEDEDINSTSKSNLLRKINALQNEVYHSSAALYDDVNYCKKFVPKSHFTTIGSNIFVNYDFENQQSPQFDYTPAYLDSSFAFKDAGIILLTNQNLRTAPCVEEDKLLMISREVSISRKTIDDPIWRNIIQHIPLQKRKKTLRKSKSELIKRVRDFFPQSWLWGTFRIDSVSKKMTLHLTAPDRITTWRTNFVCVSSAGLGIAPSAKITVFQPFFLQVSLPDYVVSGELVRLPISVHSYSNFCYQIDIKLKSQISLAVDGSERQICMCSSDKPKISTSFNLRFSLLQNQSVQIHATAAQASVLCVANGNNQRLVESSAVFGAEDVVNHVINVIPEGVTESATQSIFLCGKGTATFGDTVTFELRSPEGVVPLSLTHNISWTGDILGPSISNLANLVQMPYGGGEKNLATMVPSIFVLKYLEATSSGSDELKTKALDYIDKGYKKQLHYQLPDGSFSAFGTRDVAGSTWLTAFVVRSFYEASQFYPNVNVNGTLSKAINYLFSQQNQISGCFDERGRVLNSYMQGGVGQTSNLALTAYVLPTLAAHLKKNAAERDKVRTAQNLGVQCLLNGNFFSQSNYILALGTYALVDMPQFEVQLTMGRTKIRENLQGDYKEKFLSYSGRVEPIKSSNTWWRPNRTSVDVETTAYALLALHKEGDLSSNLPLVRWLTAQRNAFGGWRSTQDTVVSLRALSVFGATLSQGYSGAAINLNIKINVETQSTSSIISYDVNEDNRLVEQIRKLEPSSRRITVEAKGVGCVVLVANTVFNLPAPIRPEAPFTLTLKTFTKPVRCEERKLQLAVKYNGAENESGMALLRIRLPTGWYTEQSEESRLLTKYRQNGLKRVEMDGQTVEIYLDSISKANVQLYEVIIKRKFMVKDLKPSVVTVADYYRPELNKEVMLIIADCEEAAKINVEPPAPTPRPNSPPSCPVCSLNKLDTTVAKNGKTIADILCSKWSAFVLTKRIQNQGRNGYKILRPDDNGTVVIWEVFSLELPPSCHKNCPLLNESIVPDELFFISRYSYRGGIWPGSVQLAPNSDFLIVDADTSFNLEDKIPTDCAGRENLLSFIAIQKRRRAEFENVVKANKPAGGCPLCFHNKLTDVLKNDVKNRYCAAYLNTANTFSYNSLFTLKSVVSNKYFELGTVGSTETRRIYLTLKESCRCALLNKISNNDTRFLMIPPKGWSPIQHIKLDKRFLFISLNQSKIYSSTCKISDEPETTVLSQTSPTSRIFVPTISMVTKSTTLAPPITTRTRTTTKSIVTSSAEGSGEGSGTGLGSNNMLFI